MDYDASKRTKAEQMAASALRPDLKTCIDQLRHYPNQKKSLSGGRHIKKPQTMLYGNEAEKHDNNLRHGRLVVDKNDDPIL